MGYENYRPNSAPDNLSKDSLIKKKGPRAPRNQEGFSRRDFLKKSALATGLLAATPFVRSASKLLESDFFKQQKTEPSNPQGINEPSSLVSDQFTASVQEIKNPKPTSEKKEMPPNKLIDQILAGYNILSKDKHLWPTELFSDDFLIAQQLQESLGNKNAISHKGARGVMQVMASAIQDSAELLYRLKDKYKIPYSGPLNLSSEELQEIAEQVIQKSDYSRSIGKLYSIRLFMDQDFDCGNGSRPGYGIGREAYAKGDIKQARREIIAAYNMGPANFKKFKKTGRKFWDETEEYCQRITDYTQKNEKIRHLFLKNKLQFVNSNPNYAIYRTTKRVIAVESPKGQEFILEKCVNKLKEAQAQKGVLSHRDIDLLLASGS